MSFEHSGVEPFSLADLTEKCRNGTMPSGYIDAMLARQRRIHAALLTQIEGATEAVEKVGNGADFRF